MVEDDIRAGQLTLLAGGTPLLVRAYTYDAPGSPEATVDNLFRIASCSKAFTCAAITKLHDDHTIDMSTPVLEYLGIPPTPTTPADPRVEQITIGHLVDHAGGWNPNGDIAVGGTTIPGAQWDPTYDLRSIALQLP